jgi:metal transporter CNNM
MEDVFTMSADTVLDEKTMDVILSAGYSRIPIFVPGDEYNFCGMLLVKILITYDPEDCKKVSEFALATLPETAPETSCLDIVNFFQEGKSHMVLVSSTPGENTGALGVVTLEDVIEELIGEYVSGFCEICLAVDKSREIIDESDVYIDVHKAIRRMAPAPKARSNPVGHSETSIVTVPEHQLIDLSDAAEGAPMANKIVNGNRDKTAPSPAAVFGTSPKTTFMRRSTSLTDNVPIPVRGNVNDMREHLKHLGPSNLASRPKSTRYNTVKIKNSQAPARSNSVTDAPIHRDSIVEEPYHDEPTLHGGEGEGLLKSAGREASDGVQALHQGYGSIPRTNGSKSYSFDGAGKDSSVTVDRSHSPHSPKRSPSIFRNDSHDSNRSSDTLGSLNSGNHSPSHRKRGAARSGSITENIIESRDEQQFRRQ